MATQMQESVTDTAGQMASQAGEKVGQAVEMAKQETTSRLEGERERVAESLYTTAHALRQVGQELREQQQGSIATLADRAAQQAEHASGYLRSRDMPQLIDDTEQLGRAHPMLFAGGALGLGLLGVRFLKSTRRQQVSGASGSTAMQTLEPGQPAFAPYGLHTGVGGDVSAVEGRGASNLPPMPADGVPHEYDGGWGTNGAQLRRQDAASDA